MSKLHVQVKAAPESGRVVFTLEDIAHPVAQHYARALSIVEATEFIAKLSAALDIVVKLKIKEGR